MPKKLSIFLSLTICFSGLAENVKPFESKQMVFGKPAYVRHFEDPEDAIKPWKPVVSFVEANYSHTLEMWVLEETNDYYEGSDIQVSLFNNKGEHEVSYPRHLGPYVYSFQTKAFLFCETSAHFETQYSYLYDRQSKLINKIKSQGGIYKCGVSDDGKVFWLQYGKTEHVNFEDLTMTSVILFISPKGEEIQSIELKGNGSYELNYLGKVYRFEFNEFALP